MPASPTRPRAPRAAVSCSLGCLGTWQCSAPGETSQPIVILGIDEPTFQQLRLQWPFPRSLHGQLLGRVRADGARAVGLHIAFT